MARRFAWFAFAAYASRFDKALPPIHLKPSSNVLLLPLSVGSPSVLNPVTTNPNNGLYTELVK